MPTPPHFDAPGDYLRGRFVVPSHPDDVLRTLSPAHVHELVGVHPVSLRHVEEAIAAAREAFPAWRRTPRAEREAALRRYQRAVREHAEDIALTIAREVGKARWEAEAEARALAAKVDAMIGPGSEWTRNRTVPQAPGEIRYRPHGLVAVIGPFNFPAHLPNGQIVPALLHGNCVLFKPSEKAPSVASLVARCFHEAGFPPGVFQLLQGGSESARALVAHEEVDAVLFTGSVPVGKAIAKACAERPGKLVALELGGKNASIVLPDADLDLAARHVAFAAYATAGQRCTATSRLIVHRDVLQPLLDRLTVAARGAVVGHPLQPGVFMGPLVSGESMQRLLRAQERARAAGFEPIVAGGPAPIEGYEGHYVRPAIHLAPHADVRVEGYTHDELFGPDIAVYPVGSDEEAAALTDATRYGLVASVFTRSRERFEWFAEELRVGLVHWNRSTAGASGLLPFGGVKDSGNHRPAGITAGLLATYPMAVLHAPPDAPLPSWEGLPFQEPSNR